MAKSRNFPHSFSLTPSSPLPLPCHLRRRDSDRLRQGFVSVNGLSCLVSLSFSSTKSIPLSSSLSISLEPVPSLSSPQRGAHTRSDAPCRRSIARAIQPCSDGDEMVDCRLPATGASTLAHGGAHAGAATIRQGTMSFGELWQPHLVPICSTHCPHRSGTLHLQWKCPDLQHVFPCKITKFWQLI